MNSMTHGLVRRSRRDSCPGAQRGFTLLELMIVVLIISVLAAIAISSYGYAVRKTRRGAAQGCLTENAQYMERFYTTNMAFNQTTGGTAVALPTCSTDVTKYYTISFAAGEPTATTYKIQAVPSATGGQTKDTTCGTMTINQVGTKTPSTAGCW